MNKTKILAPGIAIVMVLMLATAAALLATPVLADPPVKYVTSLEDDNEDRYGQAIFNTNQEDEGCYELVVEVEDCIALASSTVEVSLNDVVVGAIAVNQKGNGKATFCVETISTGDIITVEDELIGDDWQLWTKGKGKK